MIDLNTIDELSRKLTARLPPGVADMKSDLQEQFRQVLSRQLRRMDLVSREEFDAQTAVLERTRLQLEALQNRLDALEQN